MRKGIWEEFDGYDDIIKEIEASRKTGKMRSFKQDLADPYITRLHPKQLDLRVVDIIQETPSTKTFRLVAEDNYLPPFQAGQYISLFLDIDGIRTSRPYSISSQPRQIGFYDITVRRLEGGLVSNFLLDRIQIGDALKSSGPQGHFYHNPLYHEKTMICIAGGSGITPFMSMIREITECGIDRNVLLFYGNQNTDDVIFHQELLHLSQRFENIRYISVIENPETDYDGKCGLITGEIIQEAIGSRVDGRTFFLCGPQGMYDFCIPALELMGVPKRSIRRELYGPPVDICQYPGWPEDVSGDDIFKVAIKNGENIQAPANVPLLVSLEKGGIIPPSICRSGECSMCRVKVLSGSVFQPSGTPVRKSDHKYGYVHACVSYPLEDLEILL
jgi:ferredoxin-NADP reductase/ferredoxin